MAAPLSSCPVWAHVCQVDLAALGRSAPRGRPCQSHGSTAVRLRLDEMIRLTTHLIQKGCRMPSIFDMVLVVILSIATVAAIIATTR